MYVAITKRPEKILESLKFLDEYAQNLILDKIEHFEDKSPVQKMLLIKYTVNKITI